MEKNSGKGRSYGYSSPSNTHLESPSWESAGTDMNWGESSTLNPGPRTAWDASDPKTQKGETESTPVSTPGKSSTSAMRPRGLPKASIPSVRFRLSFFPDEILEQVLVELSLVDINNLLAGADLVTRNAIRRNIYNPASKDDPRNTQVVAVIAQDNNLYKRGQLSAIRTALHANIRQALGGAVTSIAISGSTCLMASDLLVLASPIGGQTECPALRNIEIYDSPTFSPLALLHHATRRNLTFGQITFTMTGEHPRWPQGRFKYAGSLQLATAFLYAYGAKLWHHFPAAFSKNDVFGRWLNYNTNGMFFNPRAWKFIQYSSAKKYEPPISYGDMDLDEEDDDTYDEVDEELYWKDMSPARKDFAWRIAGAIFESVGKSYERNPERYGKDYPCQYCNQRLPEFCWQDAQMKLHQREEGMCVLCAYDRYEESQDEGTLEPYKSSIRHPRPDSLPHYWWKPETLGCRTSLASKKIMQFEEMGYDEDENNAAEQDNHDDEFCKVCDEAQLDEEEMKVGICKLCEKETASQKKNPSFREIRDAKKAVAARLAVRKDRSSWDTHVYQDSDEPEDVAETEDEDFPATTVAAIAQDQTPAQDLTSTPMEEEDGAVENAPDSEDQGPAAEGVQVATEDLTSTPMEEADVAISQNNVDESETGSGVIGTDEVEGNEASTPNIPQQLTTRRNLSDRGDTPATSTGGPVTTGDIDYKAFIAFYEESERLSQAGVRLCRLCRVRLENNEVGVCGGCASIRTCHHCGDDLLGSTESTRHPGYCVRCVT